MISSKVFTMRVRKLSVEEWDKEFQPITNPFDDNASWDGVMFETYGKELAYVRMSSPQCVWTYVDGEDGTYLCEGWHVVNRIGFFVTKNSWDKDTTYDIQVHDDNECLCYADSDCGCTGDEDCLCKDGEE